MRLYVSGLGPSISIDDLQEKFASAGRVLDVYRPEPRHLGVEVIQREYAFIEIAEEDRERAQKVLQGSTWKGQKVRIAEAQPDYKQKIRSEAAFSESEEADTGQPASEEEDQQLEDIDPEGPSQDLDTQSSSRYHRNSLWEQMVDAQASRPDLDPELFSSSAVLPVSMVSTRPPVPSHQSELVQTTEDVVKQPSEAVRTLEILSRYATLDAPEAGNENTAVAVSFSDDEAIASPAMKRQQAEKQKQLPRLDYNSSSDEDGEQHAPGDRHAVDATRAALGGQPEAPLVALSADQRGVKHMLDFDDGVDALRMEEGEDKMNLHRISAGVDVLGGFDGHMDSPRDLNDPGAVDVASDEQPSGSVDGDSGSGSEGEAELLRSLLMAKSASNVAADSIESCLSDEEQEQEESGSDQDDVPHSEQGELPQSASERQVNPVGLGTVTQEKSESEGGEESSSEEEDDQEDDEQIVGDEMQPSGSESSGADDSIPQDETDVLQQGEIEGPGESDAWAAAFRLAAGGVEVPASDAEMSEGEGEQAEPAAAETAVETADADLMDTEAVIEAGNEHDNTAAKLKRARPSEEEEKQEDYRMQHDVVMPGPRHKSKATKRGSNTSGLEASRSADQVTDENGNDGAGSGELWELEDEKLARRELERRELARRGESLRGESLQGEDDEEGGHGSDDMNSDGLKAQMQELEREMMLEQKAAKSASKPKRGDAKRDVRRQKRRLSAVSKDIGEEEDCIKEPDPSKPKTPLAQIFREQRELAEEMQSTQAKEDDAPDAEQTHTAATEALFSQLPFHTAPSTQQKRPHKDTTARLEEQKTAKKQQEVELETADSFIRKFAPASIPDATVKGIGAQFKRTEDLAVLEGRLKVTRPALLADMKSKLRMHLRRKQAEKDVFTKKRKK